jgi:hypothetical protein
MSPEKNHAHANQMIDMSGAVIPLAVNQRCQTSARPISVAEVVRLARLCVLIFLNPILPGAAIHLDLAGTGILSPVLRRACRLNPPASQRSG